MCKQTYWAGYWILVLGLLMGCKEREEVKPAQPSSTQDTRINNAIYEIMKEVYLWNDQLPASFNPAPDATPGEVIEALKYKPLDRFSYIEDLSTFLAYFEGGQYVGNGFGMHLDAAGKLWVTYVYPSSPADRAGFARGSEITKVNGQPLSALVNNQETFSAALGENKAGVQTRFTLRDPAGNAREVTLTKESVTISSVVHREVKQVGSKRVGYLVFTTFIDKSNAELDEAFSYFKSQGVNELVLDLRYNGGGSLDVAKHLSSLIAPNRAGQEFVELTYNAKNQEANETYKLTSEAQGINLSRLLVITSDNTASASEAVINGLRPYIPVITVGSTTYGKPVGMNALPLDKNGNLLDWEKITATTEGYAFLPIMFKVANTSGQAEYFEGIPADGAAADDVTAPFGTVEEDSFGQALYYIQNGAFSPVLASGRRAAAGRGQRLPVSGFRAEVGAF